MNAISTVLLYTLTFLAMYVEMFFLVTFFETHKKIESKYDDSPNRVYPPITIIVPCWNEEKTVEGTVESLLALDYPKDSVHIILVDDGSTDSTWQVFQKYKNNPMIKLVHKENGGKHTAMNLGITMAKTEFIACLDADSFVTPSALKRMMPYFDDPETMSVSPSIIVHNPDTIIRSAQKAEYQLSVYVKKMLGMLGGIHVTPGPLSIYRMKVFRDLGDYKYAHKTEDMEIAFRMQENHYKIEQCHDAFVYTKAPPTVYALYKQRLRWIYGFINNTIDYRRLIFKREYGTFALFTIPAGVIGILSALYLFTYMAYGLVNSIIDNIFKFQATGSLIVGKPALDWFFVDTHAFVFMTIVLYGLVLTSLILGSKMANGKVRFSMSMLYYIVIYSFIAPFWLIRALYKTIMRKEVAWR